MCRFDLRHTYVMDDSKCLNVEGLCLRTYTRELASRKTTPKQFILPFELPVFQGAESLHNHKEVRRSKRSHQVLYILSTRHILPANATWPSVCNTSATSNSQDGRKRTMQVGDMVWAKWREQGMCYRGAIHAVNADGTVDINYDDGLREQSVKSDRIHRTANSGKLLVRFRT